MRERRDGVGWNLLPREDPLVFVENTIDAVGYVNMLQMYLESFIDSVYPGGVTFQQDSAPAHRSEFTSDYSTTAGVMDLPWPPCSPGMNVI